jgi:hypothetical protein
MDIDQTDSSLIYLARPIDFAGAHDLGRIVEAVSGALVTRGYIVYDPGAGAFNVPQDVATGGTGVRKVNEYVQSISCATVALLFSDIHSVGVPMEIHAAHSAQRPLVILGDMAASSWSLRGVGHHVSLRLDASDAQVDESVRSVVEFMDRHVSRGEPQSY